MIIALIKKYYSIVLSIFLLVFFIFLPVFEIRLSITCIVLLKLLNSKLNLGRSTILFLYLIFLFAYIFSPYWNAFSTLQEKIAAFIILLIIGFCWSFFSSSVVSWNFRHIWKPPLILLTLLLYTVNYIPIHADIPWRGDEDFHINVTMDLLDFLQHSVPIPIRQVTRYPLLEKWVSAAFIFPNTFGNIALYRIVPFLSTILLAWLIYFQSRRHALSEWKSVIIAFAATTLPTVYFFTSLLYMEMPIVFLMTYVIFQARKLIISPPQLLKSISVWYALLIISFLKETALAFLLVCMSFRAIYQLYHSKGNRHTFAKSVFDEGFLTILVVIPNLIFQFFRLRFPVIINNPPALSAVRNLSTYPILFMEYAQEFGFFLVPAVLGIIIYFVKREYQMMLLLLTLFCSEVLLFLLMRADYVGYARFNLFLLPVLVVAAVVFFTHAGKRVTAAMLIAILICNIILFPIRLDGTRLPNWGSPAADSAEYSYPYDQAIKALKSVYPNSPLIILGQYYMYSGFRYYFGRYSYQPKVYYYYFNSDQIYESFRYFNSLWFNEAYERTMLVKFFSDYKSGNLPTGYLSTNVILFHSVNNINLDDSVLYGDAFKIIKRIKNAEHSLYLFRRV